LQRGKRGGRLLISFAVKTFQLLQEVVLARCLRLFRVHHFAGRAVAGAKGKFALALAVLAMTLALAYTRSPGQRVAMGLRDDVYYSGNATAPEARSLGQALQEAGYLHDQGATVLLSKWQGKKFVSLVVQEGIWNDPEAIEYAEMIARQVTPSIGGLPIELRLVDTTLSPKRTVTVN
jgi:hypothetical protein